MKQSAFAIGAVLSLLLAGASPASAADKAHQQLMAEIRMLQEQQQQLQQMMGALAETLKTVTTKIDDQNAANRKAFADQKLQIDNVAEGVRDAAGEGRRHQRAVVNRVTGARGGSAGRFIDAVTTRHGRAAGTGACRAGCRSGRSWWRGGRSGSDHSTWIGAADFAAAHVRQRLQRLHGRPVPDRDSRVQRVHLELPALRQGRRCAVQYRKRALFSREVPEAATRFRR